MKLTEKEKKILEMALIHYKEECYTLWHAGEIETANWQDQALMIESIRRKMYKSKTEYSVSVPAKFGDDII